jgi:hypothetical protein
MWWKNRKTTNLNTYKWYRVLLPTILPYWYYENNHTIIWCCPCYMPIYVPRLRQVQPETLPKNSNWSSCLQNILSNVILPVVKVVWRPFTSHGTFYDILMLVNVFLSLNNHTIIWCCPCYMPIYVPRLEGIMHDPKGSRVVHYAF